jgi:hypothetical protein
MTPTARVIAQTENRTVWAIKWPSTMLKGGKTYIATTYPSSDLVFIETAANRRAVGGTVKARLEPVIRRAIAEAKGA